MYKAYAKFGTNCISQTSAFTSNNKYFFDTDSPNSKNYLNDYSYCGTSCMNILNLKKIENNNKLENKAPIIVYKPIESYTRSANCKCT